ncbi:MAG TPA: NAD(P)H-dependent glycerol-3-phosphate dehydrogenase, partial [Proteobacteria bacterium]|nr:NAD(P)H-dependent glycerol-3-phosphate dehydrogenase [Pseudomonadota bacterium]
VYRSDDVIGVQIGGALKNVIAIAAGGCDGLGLGLNARAALITRGLAELTRLGVAKGANPLTFLGLAGMGDLVLTCTGDLSRNRTFGMRVARGESPKEVIDSMNAVVEGYYAAVVGYKLSRKLDVDMPITEQVYLVLHEGKSIQDALRDLLKRGFKDELKGIA